MLLNWTEDPSTTRGIHFATGTGWDFRSYAELASEALAVADALADRAAGGDAGGAVGLALGDPQRFTTGFFGTLLAGLTPSPVATPASFRDRDAYRGHLAGVLRAADPVAVLADDRAYEAAAAAAGTTGHGDRMVAHPGPDAKAGDRPRTAGRPAPALLQFTSGSSGTPKGVRVGWDSLAANVAAIRGWTGWSAEDSFASWLPLYHDMGLVGALITPVVSGTDLWLMSPEQFLRTPRRWLECFGAHGATLTTAPGFGYAYTARRVRPEDIGELDFSGWRVAILGAERIDPAGVAAFTALTGPRGFRHTSLVPAYGMAEVTLAATGTAPGTPAPVLDIGTRAPRTGEPVRVRGRGVLGVDGAGGAGLLTGCGAALSGLTVTITDEDGAPLPDGRFGEIELRGSSVADGYRTADGPLWAAPGGGTAFLPPAEGGAAASPEGLRTGDFGFLLDGTLYVLGRIGDSLKVRGRKLFAEDLEAALTPPLAAHGIRCAVVLGSAAGQDLALVLLEQPEPAGSPADEVLAAVRAHTSDQVRIVVLRGPRGAIPRTSSGKPRRRVLWRELTRSAVDGGADGGPSGALGGGTAAGDGPSGALGGWQLLGDSGPDDAPPLPWEAAPSSAPSAASKAPAPASLPGSDAPAPSSTVLPDITEPPAGQPPLASLPTSRELYERWEKQQWSVRDVAVERDAAGWRELRPFARHELLSALAELEVGEVCVTQTLSSLVDHAPTEDDRIYLCTQLADEGRHVRFFQDYLEHAAGVDLTDPQDGKALEQAAAYGQLFEPELRRATAAAREASGGAEAWYRALTYYHLITEGVLAATALRTTRALARRFSLKALDEGLTNVTRDETRHVTFGLTAARAGVRGAFREAVADSYLTGVELAARVMVAPDRRTVSPRLRAALTARAAQLTGQWTMARDRMLRQLGQIGLAELGEEAGRRWDAGRERALDEYRERWGTEHPVRLAG
ncbi:hypothetical protein ACZ90_12415 [Streptomyces albus subsp. albus]|nr:hypothetical protein ACZ90_12415 [Streptomyces albus subsp. albus]